MRCLAKPKETEKLHKGTRQAGLATKISTIIDARILIGKGYAILAWTQRRVDGVPYVNLERICLTRRTELDSILTLQLIRIISCRMDFKIMRSKTQKLQTLLKVMTAQMWST